MTPLPLGQDAIDGVEVTCLKLWPQYDLSTRERERERERERIVFGPGLVEGIVSTSSPAPLKEDIGWCTA